MLIPVNCMITVDFCRSSHKTLKISFSRVTSLKLCLTTTGNKKVTNAPITAVRPRVYCDKGIDKKSRKTKQWTPYLKPNFKDSIPIIR